MKRFSMFLLTLIALLVPLSAHSGEWYQRELRWFKTSIGPYGGSTQLFARDTSFNVLGGAVTTSGDVLDTTATFNLKNGAPVYFSSAQPPGVAGRGDSLIAGYLIFESDSSVVPTGAMSSISLILEGNASQMSWPGVSAAGWTPIDSLTALCVNGDVSITVAIPTKGGQKITTRATQGLSPYSFENLRARVVASVGALPSARVFLRYWKP